MSFNSSIWSSICQYLGSSDEAEIQSAASNFESLAISGFDIVHNSMITELLAADKGASFNVQLKQLTEKLITWIESTPSVGEDFYTKAVGELRASGVKLGVQTELAICQEEQKFAREKNAEELHRMRADLAEKDKQITRLRLELRQQSDEEDFSHVDTDGYVSGEMKTHRIWEDVVAEKEHLMQKLQSVEVSFEILAAKKKASEKRCQELEHSLASIDYESRCRLNEVKKILEEQHQKEREYLEGQIADLSGKLETCCKENQLLRDEKQEAKKRHSAMIGDLNEKIESLRLALEALIFGTHNQVDQTGDPCRIVGLSATLPNYRDLKKFLNVIQMLGRAGHPQSDSEGQGILITHHSELQYYLSLMNIQLPCESQMIAKLPDFSIPLDETKTNSLLDHRVADLVHTESYILYMVGLLTWTLIYRRMTRNPNNYNMLSVSHRHLSGAMSDLVENVLQDLENSKCIAIKDDDDCMPLNLGIIAPYYYISYTTIEVFNMSLKQNTKSGALFEVISSASEFSEVPIRHKEDVILRKLVERFPSIVRSQIKHTDPHSKVNLLLNVHLSWFKLAPELTKDTGDALQKAMRLTQVCVDVLSSRGWPRPAINVMEVSQMLTQVMYSNEYVLKQLPPWTSDILECCKENNLNNVWDSMDLEDEERNEVLQMEPAKLANVARFYNSYPAVEVNFKCDNPKVAVSDKLTVQITLERENDGLAPPVVAPLYPLKRKNEAWWVVLGDQETNELPAIKRVPVNTTQKFSLDFVPTKAGKHAFDQLIITYKIYLLSKMPHRLSAAVILLSVGVISSAPEKDWDVPKTVVTIVSYVSVGVAINLITDILLVFFDEEQAHVNQEIAQVEAGDVNERGRWLRNLVGPNFLGCILKTFGGGIVAGVVLFCIQKAVADPVVIRTSTNVFGGFELQGDVVIRDDWYGNGIPNCLKGGEVQPRVAAITMMPDGYPLVGPIDTRQNYWLHGACIDGVGRGGGIAKYVVLVTSLDQVPNYIASCRCQFIVLTDPERESRDLHWLQRAAIERNFDVELNAVSQCLSSLALADSNSRDVLGELRKSDVSDAGFGQGATKLMRLASNFSVMAAPISTSTGLLSYEYFHNRADSLKFNQPADRKN